MRAKAIRPTTMHEHNALIVLQLIVEQGPLSRADIARRLGLSKSTASGIAEYLLRERLVVVAGPGTRQPGRTPELLSFNPAAQEYIGVDLRRETVAVASINLAGKITQRCSFPLDERCNPENVVAVITEGCNTLGANFSAVGVMVPGIVDAEEGTVLYSSNLGWMEPVPLLQLLRTSLGSRREIPVYIENDANALALAVTWAQENAEGGSLVYLLVERGVGGAFVSPSQLFYGSNYAGLEAGKTLVTVPGEDEPCTVERALSTERLEFLFGPAQQNTTSLYDHLSSPAGTAPERIAYVADIFGQLCANLIALLNPGAIMIDAPVRDGDRNLVQCVLRRTRELLPSAPEKTVRILTSSLQRSDRVVGGAALAIYRSKFRFLIAGRTM